MSDGIVRDLTPRWLQPGFSRDTVLNYLFKNSISRVDTGLRVAYYQESRANKNYFLESLATDVIPSNPPTDFVTLTPAQIAQVFEIEESEIDEFITTVHGENVFSIERSTEYPYILRINNLLLKPEVKNINGTFIGTTSRTRVNLIAQSINYSFGDGNYKHTLKRTGLPGELSLNGTDIVNIHHLAYIFDTDNGYISLHEEDLIRHTPNPIRSFNPPAITCYVYRGSFGRLGWQIKNNALILNESQLLLGKNQITDQTLLLDVSGSAFIDDLVVNSLSTHSDERLKTNVRAAEVNKKILDLTPVHYNYKSAPDVKEFGLIAQDVQKVAPDIVKEGEFLSVQYDRLGVYLLPIVKEQQARIEKLENQLEALTKLLMRC